MDDQPLGQQKACAQASSRPQATTHLPRTCTNPFFRAFACTALPARTLARAFAADLKQRQQQSGTLQIPYRFNASVWYLGSY